MPPKGKATFHLVAFGDLERPWTIILQCQAKIEQFIFRVLGFASTILCGNCNRKGWAVRWHVESHCCLFFGIVLADDNILFAVSKDVSTGTSCGTHGFPTHAVARVPKSHIYPIWIREILADLELSSRSTLKACITDIIVIRCARSTVDCLSVNEI